MVAPITPGQHMEGCPPLHSCILHHLLQPQVGFHQLLPHSPHFTVLSYGFGDEEDGAWSYNRGEFENVVNYFKDNISLLSRVSPSFVCLFFFCFFLGGVNIFIANFLTY